VNNLSKKSFIQENMNSQDPFIKSLYTDLHNRITDFEEANTRIEKIKLMDARGSCVIVGAIVLFLVTVIL